jgi:Methylamine utilisation protein MauE
MTILAGPFAIATVVLALGGALKALEPAETAYALRLLRLPSAPLLVRAGGAFELVVALGALVTGATALAVVVALSYAAFAVVVMLALSSGTPISSCGCLGRIETPPSWVHVGIDLAAAGVAGAAAIAVDTQIALPDVLSRQPLLGVPFLVLVAVGVALVFLAFTALPKTMAAARRLRP